MEILHCTAEYDKVYYVEYEGALHECELIATESGCGTPPVYILDIAGIGIVRIPFQRENEFFRWYDRSRAHGILYETVEDFRNDKPIIDEYGSTDNAYNSWFICPLFSTCDPCNCGGDTYTWSWDGTKAVKYIVNWNSCRWIWDRQGFRCSINEKEGWYASKEACEKANTINIVKFERDDDDEQELSGTGSGTANRD